jgi:spore germination protein YaaH
VPHSWSVRRYAGALVLAVLLIVGTRGSVLAQTPLHSSAFLTYGKQGEDKVDTDGKDLEKILVFAYHITPDGDVLPPTPWVPDVLDRLMANPRGRVIFIVVNNRVLGPDGKPAPFHSGDTVQAILSDPAKRREHIRQLAALSGHADGLELNYENLPAESRRPFTDFIRDLRAAMPRERKLSIVLQPKTTNAPGTRGRAVDWRAIEPYADDLRIESYYYSYSTSPPGPAVPVDTLRALAEYALSDPEQSIPRDKVSIILSLWGWDWPVDGTPGRLIDWDEAIGLATSHGVTPTRDPKEKSLHFRYTDDGGVEHEVWIDDFEATRERIGILQRSGMPRIDFWHLNTGDPRTWDFIRANAASSVPPSGATKSAPGDFDGDGSTDVAVFRPKGARWLVDRTREGGTDLAIDFGQSDDVPVPGDYDGDGRTDLAVYRPSYGGWFVDTDGNGGTDLQAIVGGSGAVPVPGDYDGSGHDAFAVFDRSTAAWTIDSNHDGVPDSTVVFGKRGDIPVPGDYDGDGKTDLAVFRPSTARWLIDTTHDGIADLRVLFGKPGDIPVPSDYDADGVTDLAVFRPGSGRWLVDTHRYGSVDVRLVYGQRGDVPVLGDYDGDGRTDFAVYRPSSGGWFVDTSHEGGTDLRFVYGKPGDVPLRRGGAVIDMLMRR